MRCAFLLTSVLAFAVALPGTGIAAAPVAHFHIGPISDTFPDELCGIPGTSSIRFLDNHTIYADGTFLDTSNFRQVFTADGTGKQVQFAGVEQVTGPFNPIDNGDGTITQTFTFKGLPVKLSIPNGPTLVRDAGNATEAITFRVEPDGSLEFVSETVLGEKGPHPVLDNDAVFCDVVVSALTGP